MALRELNGIDTRSRPCKVTRKTSYNADKENMTRADVRYEEPQVKRMRITPPTTPACRQEVSLSWSALPADLLQTIGRHLHNSSSLADVRLCCKAWHTYVPQGVQLLDVKLQSSYEDAMTQLLVLAKCCNQATSAEIHIPTPESQKALHSLPKMLAAPFPRIQTLILSGNTTSFSPDTPSLKALDPSWIKTLKHLKQLTLKGIAPTANGWRELSKLTALTSLNQELTRIPESSSPETRMSPCFCPSLSKLNQLCSLSVTLGRGCPSLLIFAKQLTNLTSISLEGVTPDWHEGNRCGVDMLSRLPKLAHLHLGLAHLSEDMAFVKLLSLPTGFKALQGLSLCLGFAKDSEPHLWLTLNQLLPLAPRLTSLKFDHGWYITNADWISPCAGLTGLTELQISLTTPEQHSTAIPVDLNQLSTLTGLQKLVVESQSSLVSVPVTAKVVKMMGESWPQLESLSMYFAGFNFKQDGLESLHRLTALTELAIGLPESRMLCDQSTSGTLCFECLPSQLRSLHANHIVFQMQPTSAGLTRTTSCPDFGMSQQLAAQFAAQFGAQFAAQLGGQSGARCPLAPIAQHLDLTQNPKGGACVGFGLPQGRRDSFQAAEDSSEESEMERENAAPSRLLQARSRSGRAVNQPPAAMSKRSGSNPRQNSSNTSQLEPNSKPPSRSAPASVPGDENQPPVSDHMAGSDRGCPLARSCSVPLPFRIPLQTLPLESVSALEPIPSGPQYLNSLSLHTAQMQDNTFLSLIPHLSHLSSLSLTNVFSLTDHGLRAVTCLTGLQKLVYDDIHFFGKSVTSELLPELLSMRGLRSLAYRTYDMPKKSTDVFTAMVRCAEAFEVASKACVAAPQPCEGEREEVSGLVRERQGRTVASTLECLEVQGEAEWEGGSGREGCVSNHGKADVEDSDGQDGSRGIFVMGDALVDEAVLATRGTVPQGVVAGNPHGPMARKTRGRRLKQDGTGEVMAKGKVAGDVSADTIEDGNAVSDAQMNGKQLKRGVPEERSSGMMLPAEGRMKTRSLRSMAQQRREPKQEVAAPCELNRAPKRMKRECSNRGKNVSCGIDSAARATTAEHVGPTIWQQGKGSTGAIPSQPQVMQSAFARADNTSAVVCFGASSKGNGARNLCDLSQGVSTNAANRLVGQQAHHPNSLPAIQFNVQSASQLNGQSANQSNSQHQGQQSMQLHRHQQLVSAFSNSQATNHSSGTQTTHTATATATCTATATAWTTGMTTVGMGSTTCTAGTRTACNTAGTSSTCTALTAAAAVHGAGGDQGACEDQGAHGTCGDQGSNGASVNGQCWGRHLRSVHLGLGKAAAAAVLQEAVRVAGGRGMRSVRVESCPALGLVWDVVDQLAAVYRSQCRGI